MYDQFEAEQLLLMLATLDASELKEHTHYLVELASGALNVSFDMVEKAKALLAKIN